MQSAGPIPTLGDLQSATPWIWLWREACQQHAPLACAVAVIRWGADVSSDQLRLSKSQEVVVKKVARDLLTKLQDNLSVTDWRLKPPIRAAVQSDIRFTLNELPEDPYPEPLWNEKVDAVWSFIFARRVARAETDGSTVPKT
jgi:hypothetical protein